MAVSEHSPVSTGVTENVRSHVGGKIVYLGDQKRHAAADLRPHALEVFAKRYSARMYGSVDDLCRDPEVEAVWVATPNQYHAEHSLLAAEHCVVQPAELQRRQRQSRSGLQHVDKLRYEHKLASLLG